MKLFDDVLEAEVDLSDPIWRAVTATTPDEALPVNEPMATSDEVLWVILVGE